MSVRRRAAAAGTLPAEALTQRDREQLIHSLHQLGWSDVDIAEHTSLTTYSVGRIRDRLGLQPHTRPGGAGMISRENTCPHCETHRERIEQAVTILSQKGMASVREALVLAVLTGEVPAASAAGEVRP